MLRRSKDNMVLEFLFISPITPQAFAPFVYQDSMLYNLRLEQ